jgi:hypothetical protein
VDVVRPPQKHVAPADRSEGCVDPITSGLEALLTGFYLKNKPN